MTNRKKATSLAWLKNVLKSGDFPAYPELINNSGASDYYRQTVKQLADNLMRASNNARHLSDLLREGLDFEKIEAHLSNNPVDALTLVTFYANELHRKSSEVEKEYVSLVKELMPQAEGMKKGRRLGQIAGAKAQKTYAAETLRIIETLNSDLLKNHTTARWVSSDRAEYIAKKLAEMMPPRVQPNGKPYASSTILKKIQGKR
jgi:hypothetical protein